MKFQKQSSSTNFYLIHLGYIASFFISILAILSFLVVKPPISGPFCQENCIEYPFTDIINQYPEDYIWMFFMVALFIILPIQVLTIHYVQEKDKRIFSHAGLILVIISSAILLINYFIQLVVVQPSLINGETQGIALITQYNPHGIFIALEELGYLVLGVSFLFLSFTFTKQTKNERWIRRIYFSGFVLTILSFILISLKYGISREYIFECYAIVICWLVLIINGILTGLHFMRRLGK